jgi:excisionase family DNA binding protein
MSPLAYTDGELSSLLRVSKRTIYRLRKSGVLNSICIGRAVRTLASEVERALGLGLLPTKQERKGNENADQSARIQPQQ